MNGRLIYVMKSIWLEPSNRGATLPPYFDVLRVAIMEAFLRERLHGGRFFVLAFGSDAVTARSPAKTGRATAAVARPVY